MRSHLEPYARAGRAAPFVGSFFLPGWPSAVLFLILMEAVVLLSIRSATLYARGTLEQWPAIAAMLLMAGAALMTPPLLWQLARRKPQWPLFAHTLVLILSGALFSFHNALDLMPGSRPSQHVWLACFPPVGFWAMLDGGLALRRGWRYPRWFSGVRHRAAPFLEGILDARVAALEGGSATREGARHPSACRRVNTVTEEALSSLHLHARQVAGSLRLPFRRRSWRGLQGNWQGLGAGSSLDFQDHRPYSPGDDPRYINWQAYARSEHYTMKLYRQEVSPAMDLLIDLSPSMFVDSVKSARVSELLYWCVECALQAGAALRCYAWLGASVEPLSLEEVLSHRWAREASRADLSAVGQVPWRHGSMRVVISDLLWPGDSQPLFLRDLLRAGVWDRLCALLPGGVGAVVDGNLEMLDCESSEVRIQRVEPGLLRRYREAYERHFELWFEQALRYHVPLARVPAQGDLATALQAQGEEVGAVEWFD